MKMKSIVDDFIRIKKTKKHEENSKSAIHRMRKKKRLKRELLKNKHIKSDVIQLHNADISHEMRKMSSAKTTVKQSDLNSFTFPATFDIFSAPEEALRTIERLRSVLLHPKLKKLKLNHKKVKVNSLGSEALLGLMTKEIINLRRHQLGEDLDIEGRFPKDKIAKALVKRIGLVCELQDDAFQDASNSEHSTNFHLFRADNRYHENASVKNDRKREIAKNCVDYLEIGRAHV